MSRTAAEEKSTTASRPSSQNEHLRKWVEKVAQLMRPESIHWVDGSQEEYDRLCDEMCATGTLIRLNQDLWPGATLSSQMSH